MGSHSKVLECQASIKVHVAGILGRRGGGGTKLSSRSCSSGKSQQCQC